MTRPLTVLVLGVGGNVGQGILKALALSELPLRVIAGCIDPLSAGLYRADLSVVGPLAADPEFVPWVERLCEDEGVDAVLSGAEPVLEALAPAAAGLRERTGAVCVVSPREVLEVGQDKLRTARWLAEHGLAHPGTADAADAAAVRALADDLGLPLIAKPRRGRSAEGVALVRSEAELELYAGREGYVVQEHLTGDELTVGCVCDRDGAVRGTVAMRRELSAGTTTRAELGAFPEATAYATAIAEELRPLGPLNVQLRMRGGEPVAFELNVRFSGTTPVRTRTGFAEVEAVLRHLVRGEEIALPRVTSGTVLRYWNELYVPDPAREALERDGRLQDPWGEDVVVEDWGIRR